MNLCRAPVHQALRFPDPLYWRLDEDQRKPILQSLRDEEPALERRVALDTKQITQGLSEQRGGGIANPQLACGLLLFGEELAGKCEPLIQPVLAAHWLPICLQVAEAAWTCPWT